MTTPDHFFPVELHIISAFTAYNSGMRISIAHKVFITLLLATGVAIGGMYLFVRWSFESSFLDFIEQRKNKQIKQLSIVLKEEYQSQGNWNRFRNDHRLWLDRALRPTRLLDEHELAPPTDHQRKPGGPRGSAPPEPRLPGPKGNRPPPRPPGEESPPGGPYLMDSKKSLITGPPGPRPPLDLYPIEVDGKAVGYIGIPKGPPLRELAESRFETAFADHLLLVSGGMLLLSALLGVPLARALVKPLHRLTHAARSMTQGRFDPQLPATRSDEIGVLERDINELARTLERAEQSRRRWIADISHELRTPIAVLRGEVEALQDGVRPFNRDAIGSLEGEIKRLTRLVEDLYQLSLADSGSLSYRKQEVEPLQLLIESIKAFEDQFADHGITVSHHLNNRDCLLYADPDRLQQLFRNLLRNSLKYTHQGGLLEIRSQQIGNQLILDFEDTAPAVQPSALPHLFDRFYRVEGSRSRATGGAGLGLAICRAIVEAHEGSIEARTSRLGGLWIHLEIPG